MNRTMLKKYAKLAARKGVNVQKNQVVLLYAPVEQHELAALIADECYRAGARLVHTEWMSQEMDRITFKKGKEKSLSEVLEWQEKKSEWMTKELPCRIFITSEDPDGLKGIDPEKLRRITVARQTVLKKYRDAIENHHTWTIIAAPSEAWAAKVFPNCRKSEAVRRLWDAIMTCVRITPDNDPAAAWDEHNRTFELRCQKLTDYAFDYLHYESKNGTDLKVWLIPDSCWMGGGERTIEGQYYNPNMPTEEIFTSPMAGRAEGIVKSTLPLSHNGMLIEDFSITFENGRAVSWDAASGKDVLTKIIETDEGSAMLGELALVPFDSPINNTGILYYNTLFDENARCHLALGSGFPNVLKDFESMTPEDWKANGLNVSFSHVDFMIGSEDMNITGYTKDGQAVRIFENGNWAEEFK